MSTAPCVQSLPPGEVIEWQEKAAAPLRQQGQSAIDGLRNCVKASELIKQVLANAARTQTLALNAMLSSRRLEGALGFVAVTGELRRFSEHLAVAMKELEVGIGRIIMHTTEALARQRREKILRQALGSAATDGHPQPERIGTAGQLQRLAAELFAFSRTVTRVQRLAAQGQVLAVLFRTEAARAGSLAEMLKRDGDTVAAAAAEIERGLAGIHKLIEVGG